MTFQVTGRPLTSSGKHSGPLLMGLRYGRGDAAPARCPHPLPTSPEDQSPADHVSGREKPDTFGRELQCGSPPGACCGFKGSEPHVGAQSQPGTRITPISQGLTRASWNRPRRHERDGPQGAGKDRPRGGQGEGTGPSQLHHLPSPRRQAVSGERTWAWGLRPGHVRL